MSTIPNAKRSSILDLTVAPDSKWERYPTVDRSTLTSCTYANLSAATRIERSRLDSCTIARDKSDGQSRIERSDVKGSHISDSCIERSNLKECTVVDTTHIERSDATGCQFVRAGKVERSRLKQTVVSDKSRMERSDATQSVIAGSSNVTRSQLVETSLINSKIERANIVDCEVTECRIERTNFRGMILKYGIWKNGDLVGRTCQKEAVIMPKRGEIQREREEGMELINFQPEIIIDRKLDLPMTHPQSTGPQIGQTLHIRIQQDPVPSRDIKDPLPSADEKVMATPASDTYSNTTGLADEDRDFPFDTYEGPILDSPPPYEP